MKDERLALIAQSQVLSAFLRPQGKAATDDKPRAEISSLNLCRGANRWSSGRTTKCGDACDDWRFISTKESLFTGSRVMLASTLPSRERGRQRQGRRRSQIRLRLGKSKRPCLLR